jgi:phosphohistidine phosphatase
MQLLIVRHAIAEDRQTFAKTGKDDAERPLTPAGHRKFKGATRGLRKVAPSIDLLATSRLVRAIETGDVLQKAYGLREALRLRELEPSASPAALGRWLRKQRGHADVVAVVGHEPHLSDLVEYLLIGARGGFIALGKGGACLIDLGDGDGKTERAELRWLLTPAQLRRVGE